MSRFERPIKGVREFSQLLQFFEEGVDSATLLEDCRDLLRSQFQHGDYVAQLPHDIVLGQAVNLGHVLAGPDTKALFERCLSIHREAFAEDASKCIAACAEGEPAIRHALSRYWTLFQLHRPNTDLELEEFAVAVLGQIGDLIEGILQHYLRELFDQSRIGRRLAPASVSLGEMVGQLSVAHLGDALAPAPFAVPINQWRNIAQHHDYVVSAEEIVASYRRTKPTEVRLTRASLTTLHHVIYGIFNAVKTAHDVFFYDNWREVSERVAPDVVDPRVSRRDAAAFHFALAAASQGFEVIAYEERDKQVRATLKDVTADDPERRQLHASQFVYVLWSHTKAASTQVDYVDRDGRCRLRTIASNEDCEVAGDDFGELARRVTFYPFPDKAGSGEALRID